MASLFVLLFRLPISVLSGPWMLGERPICGRLYVTSLEGETLVLAAKPSFEILARNPLKERALASLAISTCR
jgi:hypothetical protein